LSYSYFSDSIPADFLSSVFQDKILLFCEGSVCGNAGCLSSKFSHTMPECTGVYPQEFRSARFAVNLALCQLQRFFNVPGAHKVYTQNSSCLNVVPPVPLLSTDLMLKIGFGWAVRIDQVVIHGGDGV
jgi:hypothetical protein